MQARKLVIVLATVTLGMLLLLPGCSQPEYTPINSSPLRPADSPVAVTTRKPPEDITWISPGKVVVGNFYPGARAEWLLSVHNGKNIASEFIINYRCPSYVGAGYVKAPEEAQSWVIIADANPIIMPKETKEILTVLEMPEEVIVPLDKWEFWIVVRDTSQGGTVQTELACRWLVNMRE